MIRSAAYPASQRRARRYPRSGRRGLTALTAVLLLAGLLSAAMMSWQIAVANERIRGQARHLAEVVAAEGYGLHHWLHEVRECENGEIQGQARPVCSAIAASYSFDRPDPGDADELSDDEHTSLASHSAIADWRRGEDPDGPDDNRNRVLLPRGWEMVHLVGHTTGADLPDGILVLRPPGDLVNQPTWDATRRALDVVLGPSAVPTNLVRRALTNFRPDCDQAALDDADPACDRAYFASRFARLDMNAVLRQRHAGHPALPMETNLNLGGNALENVNALRAQTGQIPEITGACPDPAGALCATGLTAAGGLTVQGDTTLDTVMTANTTVMGNVSGVTRIRVGDVQVSGTVTILGTESETTPELTACADPGAELCGGDGDLDLESATGTLKLGEATIFGDVNGDALTGVTAITADTGLFGEITGAPVLEVEGCFRSVTPFVHGARCPE